MRPLRSVVLAATTCAVIGAGCSGLTTLSAAGETVGTTGRPPADCPATPGLSFPDGWRTTSEDRYPDVSRQCTWSLGAAGSVVATLISVVIPRPPGRPAHGVEAFAVAPCEGDACIGAAPGLEAGAFARGVRPSDDSVALFYDNPGQRGPDGHRHDRVDAQAWVLTADNLCLSDLDAALVGYDTAVVDLLLTELRANAAALCDGGV